MAITNKEQGVWDLDQVYNKQMEGGIWNYTAPEQFVTSGSSYEGILGMNNRGGPFDYSGWQKPGATDPATGAFGLTTLNQNNYAASPSGTWQVKDNGTLWAWGKNDSGMAGQNTQSGPSGIRSYSSPCQIGTATNWSFACNGRQYACAVDNDGYHWTAGRNNLLGMGLGFPNTFERSSPVRFHAAIWAVDEPLKWSLSYGRGYAIDANGRLRGWGKGSGPLGNGPDYANNTDPTNIGEDTDWAQVTANASGQGGVFGAVKTDGTLWTWGWGSYGTLGLNNSSAPGGVSSPTQVGTDMTWKRVIIHSYTAMAVKTDGTRWTWGYNNWGSLGLNNTNGDDRSSPTQVGSGTDWDYTGMAGNVSWQAMLKTDGSLWFNGEAGGSEFTLGFAYKRSSPIQVPGTYSAIQGMYNASFAIRTADN